MCSGVCVCEWEEARGDVLPKEAEQQQQEEEEDKFGSTTLLVGYREAHSTQYYTLIYDLLRTLMAGKVSCTFLYRFVNNFNGFFLP